MYLNYDSKAGLCPLRRWWIAEAQKLFVRLRGCTQLHALAGEPPQLVSQSASYFRRSTHEGQCTGGF